VVDGDVRERREVKAEKLARDPEHRLAQVLELQVGHHLVLVEVVAGLAYFLGVEAVIPRLDGNGRALLGREGLHVGHLLGHTRDRGLPDGLHQLERPLGGLRHAHLEAPVGVRLVPEELRALTPQLDDLKDNSLVVVRIAVVAAAHERAKHFLAQIASLRIREERLDRRTGIEHLVRERLRKAGAIRGRRERDRRLFVREHVLAEGCIQRRQTLVDRGHLLLRVGVEPRAASREFRVLQPHQAFLLRREARFLARFVHRGDALEELRVLHDLVGERGELRLHLELDFLELGRAQRRAVDAVDGRGAIERLPAALHRGDRILEGGRRGVVGDGVDLREALLHGRLEARLEMLEADLVEGRQASESTGPGTGERVLHAVLQDQTRARASWRASRDIR
jgi:hypothetical protein